MMNHEELIIGFFENSLSDAELAAFNQLLQTDKAFAKEVEFRKTLKAAVHLTEREALKNKLKLFEQAQIKVVPIRKTNWLYAAAALIFIAATAIWLFFQKPDAKELYAAYYEPYPNTIAPITRGTESASSFQTQQAFALYEKGDYKNAEPLFQKMNDTSNASFAKIYLGICAIELDKTLVAITILSDTSLNTTEYAIIAKWYLAMAYLKSNQPKLALPLVKEVSLKEHPLKPAAKKLYVKLEAYQ